MVVAVDVAVAAVLVLPVAVWCFFLFFPLQIVCDVCFLRSAFCCSRAFSTWRKVSLGLVTTGFGGPESFSFVLFVLFVLFVHYAQISD